MYYLAGPLPLGLLIGCGTLDLRVDTGVKLLVNGLYLKKRKNNNEITFYSS